ncbi:MAG: VWA domain-containing protein [Bacteroidales bacterium]|nr:VWA domain-containing protein [Bacteroidales bacterium]
MALLTKYSLWFLPLILLIGVGYAFFLYYKNNNIIFEKKHRIAMAVLRGLAMSLLAFLLLAPMLKLTLKQTDKPVILLAIDNSESIRATKDSSYYLNEYPKAVQNLATELGNKYEIRTYKIGDENHLLADDEALNMDFSDKSTNLAAIFDDISMLYANRNVGAVVLLSDGIYNTGANPYYKAARSNFPVYTVGLGNPDLNTDLFFAGVDHNKQAFKGNMFPVELKIAANKLSGKNAELTVYEGKEEILRRTLSIAGNRYFETVKLSLEATTTGVHHYHADLTELDGEVTHKNNHVHFYVDVVESKDKVAILYNSPHPDVAAMNEALSQTDNYEVEVVPANEFKGNPSDYSLVILHQLPSKANSASNLISQLRKSGTSTLYVVGTQTDLNNFNSLNTGVTIGQSKSLTNNSMPLFNENFTSFTFSEEAKRMLPKYPPIKTIFGTYKTSVSANIFMYQKISGVDTKYPLVVFNQQNGAKTGVITGTGFWQWKLYNYLYAENHEAFNEIVDKMVLYLAAKGDKSQFRVRHADVFAENASVEFSAELYNDSYELINEPDVKMVIKGSGDTTYEAQFSKQNKGYYLTMGELPVGNYTWTATTQIGGRRFDKTGRFTVQEIMLETANLVADHDLLKSISSATNGKFFAKEDISKVANEIKHNDNIKSIASYKKKYAMMLNSPWYLAAIVLLLGIEWFLRKWNGGY